MSFGKRGPNSEPKHPAAPPPKPRPQMVATPGSATASGGNTPFIALVAGVVLLAGGAAFAAPAASSWFGSAFSSQPQLRPVADIVAGLDPTQARTAIAAEVFPEREGHAFLTTLRQHYPYRHEDLTRQFATIAIDGGDRDDMVEALNAWTLDFTVSNFTDITRSGAKGFDALADLMTDAFDAIEQAEPGACNLRNLKTYADKPDQLVRLAAYGTPVYRFNMQANQTLVELAAIGATKGPLDSTLRPEDERALQKAIENLMRDSWARDLQMQVMLTGAIPDENDLPNINACKVARSAIKRFKSIPDGTKTRLMGMAGELAPMISAQMAQLPRR